MSRVGRSYGVAADLDELGLPPAALALAILPPPRWRCGCAWLWRSLGSAAWIYTRCSPPSWLRAQALIVMRAEGVPRPLAAVRPEARCGRAAWFGGATKRPAAAPPAKRRRRRASPAGTEFLTPTKRARSRSPSRSAAILARAVARLGLDRVLELLRLRPADLVAVADGRASLPAATLRRLEEADRD